MSFREDDSRIRRKSSAENMATTRHNLEYVKTKKTCKKGMQAKRFKAALGSDYAEKVLSAVF